EIYIETAEKAAEKFHARYLATEKEYRYFILNESVPNIVKRKYVHQYRAKLDRQALKEACHYVVGEHDITTLSSAKSPAKGQQVRKLNSLEMLEDDQTIQLIFKGNGFLYQMVRIIAGVILDVGRGRYTPTDIPKLFDKKDRQAVGRTLAPSGLYL